MDIHNAARKGNAVELETLLSSSSANIDCRDEYSSTALHKAIIRGRLEAVKVLLQYGASPDAQDEDGRAALHFALDNKRFDVVELLTEGNSNVNLQDKEQRAPLHVACMLGGEEVVRQILAAHADIELRDAGQRTPLHVALLHRNHAIARLLIGHGCDVEKVDGAGNVPIMLAFLSYNSRTVRSLVEAGADVSVRNRTLMTILHLIAIQRHDWMVDVLDLFTTPDNVNAVDDFLKTPLHYAAEAAGATGCYLVEHVIASGANLDARDKSGRSPLHYVTSGEVVPILIHAGAAINASDELGETPLHQAVSRGHARVVGALLKLGANADCTDKYGFTPLHFSIPCAGDIPATLIAAGCEIDHHAQYLWDGFYMSPGNARICCVRQYSYHEEGVLDRSLCTTLHISVCMRRWSFMKLALKSGADINARDDRHRSPLHFSVCEYLRRYSYGELRPDNDHARELARQGASFDVVFVGRWTVWR